MPQSADATDAATLLNVDEVAALLGCSKRLVWRLVSENRLRRIKLGPRCVRFRRGDVEAMIQDLTEKG